MKNIGRAYILCIAAVLLLDTLSLGAQPQDKLAPQTRTQQDRLEYALKVLQKKAPDIAKLLTERLALTDSHDEYALRYLLEDAEWFCSHDKPYYQFNGRDDVLFIAVYKDITDTLLGYSAQTGKHTAMSRNELEQIQAHADAFARMTSATEIFRKMFCVTDPHQIRLMLAALHQAREKIVLEEHLDPELLVILVTNLQGHIHKWHEWFNTKDRDTKQIAAIRQSLQEKTNKALFPAVYDVYDPERIQLAVVSHQELSSRLIVDRSKAQPPLLDGNPARPDLVRVAVVEKARSFLEDPVIAHVNIYSYGNYLWNDWFVIYDGDKRRVYHREGEPLLDRTYSMVVVWKDGRISSENVRFRQGQKEGEVEVLLADSTKDEAANIQTAFFGQRLIHQGTPAGWDQLYNQFDDLYHLYFFPQFVEVVNGVPKYGDALGFNELFGHLPGPGNPVDRKTLKEVLEQDGYMRLDLKRYLEKGHEIPQIKEIALGQRGYTEKKGPGDLQDGQYRITGDKTAGYFLEVRLIKGILPHNLVGVTKTGKVVMINLTGDHTKRIGYTIQTAQQAILEENSRRPEDPIQEVHLLANASDVVKIVDGKLIPAQSAADGRLLHAAGIVVAEKLGTAKAPTARHFGVGEIQEAYKARFGEEILAGQVREISEGQVLEGIAALFGVDEGSDQRRHAKALELLRFIDTAPPKALPEAREAFFDTILGHLRRAKWQASGDHRFMPLALAVLNQTRGRSVFAREGFEELRRTNPSFDFLAQMNPLYGQEGQSIRLPDLILEHPQAAGPLRWLDIGSAPKAEGALTLNLLKRTFADVFPERAFELVGTDVVFPVYSVGPDGTIGPSKYKFGPDGTTVVNGIRYANAAINAQNDVTNPAFDQGTFDYISASAVLHQLRKPEESAQNLPLAAGLDLRDEAGDPYPELFEMTAPQQAVLTRLLGFLRDGGVLFANLTVPKWRAYNSDIFVVVQRVGNRFVIHRDAIFFRPNRIPFESAELLMSEETGEGKPHDNIMKTVGLRSPEIQARVRDFLHQADLLALTHQQVNRSIWKFVYEALDVIRARGTLREVFEAYLGNVPEAEKQGLLSQVTTFEHQIPAQADYMKVKEPFYSDVSWKDNERMDFAASGAPGVKDFGEKLVREGRADRHSITVEEHTLDIIVEKESGLTQGDVQTLLAEAIARLKDTGGKTSKLPQTIVFAILDRSPFLFEDHTGNGFIGINKALNQIQDPPMRELLRHVGVFHELCHEFTLGQGAVFESLQVMMDARFACGIMDEKFIAEGRLKRVLGQYLEPRIDIFLTAVKLNIAAEEPRQKMSFQQEAAVVEVLEPRDTQLVLAVDDRAFEQSGRSRIVFDRVGNRILVDGQHKPWGSKDPFGKDVDEVLAEYERTNPGRKVIAILPNGNLGYNDWFTGFVNGKVYHYSDDPLERQYDLLVTKMDGSLAMMTLRFKNDKGERGVFDIHNPNTDISSQIKYAVFGQRIVKDRHVNVENLSDQFDDLRHLFRFPLFQVGRDQHHLGFSDGEGELYRDKTKIGEALAGKAIELSLDPLLQKGISDEEREETFSLWGYSNVSDVAGKDGSNLMPGEYIINGQTRKMTVRLIPGTHPHSVIGLTREGKILVAAVLGNTHFRGAELEKLAANLIAEGAQDAFLWANGKDTYLQMPGIGTVKADGARGKAISAILVTQEIHAAAKKAPRQMVETGSTAILEVCL